MIWRGCGDYTYFTCMRCQQKFPIEMMEWDGGLLVCTERCKDGAINGAFELRMSREASKDTRELVPDPKLIHPVDPLTQLETLPASAGVYGG